jgi:transcriptional regulator with XRE-family HTH domain
MNERRPRLGGRRPRLHSVPDPDSGGELGIHLGDQLKNARLRVGLTQEQAAVEIGITRKTLADYEKARFPNPKLSTLLHLMATYDLRSLEELLGPIPSSRLAAAWQEEGWESTRESS